AAREYCRELGTPLVVKADGLAAGKGAMVCGSLTEADRAIALCLEEARFGEAGRRRVVGGFMEGGELGLFVLPRRQEGLALGAAQDHKAVFDDDRGPNTGGMGACSPVPLCDAAVEARVMREIVDPALRAMAKEGCPYQGVLYVGLMVTRERIRVVEFNCRF